MSELVSREVVGHLRVQTHLLRRSARDLRDRSADATDPEIEAMQRSFHALLADYLALVDGVVDALRPDSPEPGSTVVRALPGDSD